MAIPRARAYTPMLAVPENLDTWWIFHSCRKAIRGRSWRSRTSTAPKYRSHGRLLRMDRICEGRRPRTAIFPMHCDSSIPVRTFAESGTAISLAQCNRLPGNGRSETNREKWSSGLAPGPAHAKENVPCSGLPRRWAIRIRRRMT